MQSLRHAQPLRWTDAIWLAAVIWLWFSGAASAEFKSEENLQVTVQRLSVDSKNNQPVVALTDAKQRRVLFIWIGFFEASAIYSEMEGIDAPRPLTHDLLKRVIQNYEGKIQRIVITHIESNTYFATIFLEKNGRVIEIDARPSDSIVMALKFKAPIFVSKTLFETMAVPLVDQPDIAQEYGVTLQDLTPELAEYLSFESLDGVFVAAIRKGSHAEGDGLEMGDIIVKIDDRPVESLATLQQLLTDAPATVEVRIYRKRHFLDRALHLK